MIVYHGSIQEIKKPDISFSYRNLDFGQGFYTTTNKEQSERWAKRKADLIGQKNAIINEYELKNIPNYFIVKDFTDHLDSWIDFVCACRSGDEQYKQFDIIKGKVADDKVYRVVNMYINGFWDKQRTLSEIKVYPDYDQIAFISQQAIDELLKFKQSIRIML